MKRVLGAAVCLLLTLVFVLCASAQDPVDAQNPVDDPATWSLSAPQNVTLADVSEYENTDSLVFALRVACCKDGDLLSLLSEDAATRFGSRYTWVSAVLQVDWALDDLEDWKYTPEWDSLQSGHDGAVWEYFDLALTDTGTEGFTFLTLYDRNNWAWYNETRGMSSVFDGLTYWMERSDGAEVDFLDLNQHTVWVRARYVVNCIGYDENGQSSQIYLYSGWSDTAGIGKDAPAPPTELTRFPYPGVYHLSLSSAMVNGGKALEFETRHSSEMLAQNALYLANGWNQIELRAELSVNGGEWQEVPLVDPTLSQGTALLPLPDGVSADAQLEVRTWYHFEGVNGVLESEYSDILMLNPASEEENPNIAAVEEEKKCPLCGICNLPLGYCLFMWLTLLLGLQLLLFSLLGVATGGQHCPHCGRRLPKRADCCPYCGHAPDEPVQPKQPRRRQALKTPMAASDSPEEAWYSAGNTKALRHSTSHPSAPSNTLPVRVDPPEALPSGDRPVLEDVSAPPKSAEAPSPTPTFRSAPVSSAYDARPETLPPQPTIPQYRPTGVRRPVQTEPTFAPNAYSASEQPSPSLSPDPTPVPSAQSPYPNQASSPRPIPAQAASNAEPAQTDTAASAPSAVPSASPPPAPARGQFVATRKCPRCGATYVLGQHNCGMCGKQLTFTKK